MPGEEDELQAAALRAQLEQVRRRNLVDQADRIFEELKSLRDQLKEDTGALTAQIRSLTGSISSNTTDILTRLTAIEAWQGSHEKLDEAAVSAAEVQNDQRKVEIKEMAIQMGQDLGRFESVQSKFGTELSTLKEAYQQAAGASKLWKWLLGGVGLALTVLNIIHVVGGGK